MMTVQCPCVVRAYIHRVLSVTKAIRAWLVPGSLTLVSSPCGVGSRSLTVVSNPRSVFIMEMLLGVSAESFIFKIFCFLFLRPRIWWDWFKHFSELFSALFSNFSRYPGILVIQSTEFSFWFKYRTKHQFKFGSPATIWNIIYGINGQESNSLGWFIRKRREILRIFCSQDILQSTSVAPHKRNGHTMTKNIKLLIIIYKWV